MIKRIRGNETNRSKREQIKITTMEVNGRNNERTITQECPYVRQYSVESGRKQEKERVRDVEEGIRKKSQTTKREIVDRVAKMQRG